MTKDDIQNIVADKAEYPLIILNHCTGLGKSFSSLRVLEKRGFTNVLILVAEVAHKKNWKEEIKKFETLRGIKLPKVTLECYASIKKHQNTTWDMIILDEVHHLSPLRLLHLETMSATSIVALSATLNNDTINDLLFYLKIDKQNCWMHTVTLNDAIRLEILPAPDIHVIPLNLTDTKETCTIIEEWGTASKRLTYHTTLDDRWKYLKDKVKYPHIRLVIKCSEQEKYKYINDQIAYWENRYFMTKQTYHRNIWLQKGMERKRFLGERKTKYVKRLIDKLKDTRFICFCSSIEQAEQLGAEKAIHSKLKISERKLILEDFQNKKKSSIFAIGMLTEGQNLTDIEAGIIVQLDNVDRPFVQKTGRVLRSEEPKQYIFYYRDTRDEEYLKKILDGISTEYLKKLDLEMI